MDRQANTCSLQSFERVFLSGELFQHRRKLTLWAQSPPVPRKLGKAGRGPTWSAAPCQPPAPPGTSCRPVCRRWWCRSPGTRRPAGPPGWRPARAAATARSPHSGCPGTPGLSCGGATEAWGQCHSAFKRVASSSRENTQRPGKLTTTLPAPATKSVLGVR